MFWIFIKRLDWHRGGSEKKIQCIIPCVCGIAWYRFHQRERLMKAVFNPLVLTYWWLHTQPRRTPRIDCMIEIPIIANPSVSDPMFSQEQSLQRSDGCMSGALAGCCAGISSGFSSLYLQRVERWRDAAGGTSGGKNNYWAYFLPESFTHQRARRRGLFPLHCYYEMKNGRRIGTVTGRLLYLPVICLRLDRSGHCSVRRYAHPPMISDADPRLWAADGCAAHCERRGVI